MSRCRWENGVATVIAVVFVFFVCFLFVEDEPKCIKSGCNREAASGSAYCYTHKSNSYSSGYKSYRSESKPSSANSASSSSGSSAANTKKSYGSSSSYSSYRSYDEGYEAISEDDDYDWDRYYSDSDYADGVDDAMEDYDW